MEYGVENSEGRVKRREMKEWEGRVEVSERVMGTGTEIYYCLLFAGGYDIYYQGERERGDGGKKERKAAQVKLQQ